MRKTNNLYFLCCDREARGASAQSFTLCGSKQQQRSPNKITLLLLVRITYVCLLLFTYIPFVVNGTFNATPTERLQQPEIPLLGNLSPDWEFQQRLGKNLGN